MSNLPPGVTGRELAIAGPSWESTEEVNCPGCDEDVFVEAWGYGFIAHFECPECGHEWEVDERP